VVSTKVGGVPEVLPEHLIKLCEPHPQDLIEKISEAIPLLDNLNPYLMHEQVKTMYNWNDVARRTERVYDLMTTCEPLHLLDRLKKYYGCGVWAGKLFCMVIALAYLFWCFLEWYYPKEKIQIAPDLPYDEFTRQKPRKTFL